MKLSLAISPCPNDTFIFHAWIAGLLPGAPDVETRLVDIDELNAWAVAGIPDVTKLSFAAFARVREGYALLHAGGALGRGCGPLVVARADSPLLAEGRPLRGARVAIPGELTTAALLVRLYLASGEGGSAAGSPTEDASSSAAAPTTAPGARIGDPARLEVLRFDAIMPAVASGQVDAGVVIHESRFTYPALGLAAVVDLGKWWESATGHAIPLGGIAVRRDLGSEVAAAADRAVRGSLLAARRTPEASAAFIREHAQEMDEAVCRQHIDLYVNEYSLDYGRAGRAAIEELLGRAGQVGDDGAAGGGGEALPLFWDG